MNHLVPGQFERFAHDHSHVTKLHPESVCLDLPGSHSLWIHQAATLLVAH